jgi:Inhibitor of growth proteins N-terminal histone-binding
MCYGTTQSINAKPFIENITLLVSIMNAISSSSDETYLEAFIEQLTTSQWTYQVRRTMDLIRDLDTSCTSDLQMLQNLNQQLHTQIEHTIIQNFDIAELKDDENDEIPEDAPDEIDELFGWTNNNNSKSTKDISSKKRKRPQYGMRLVVNENNPDVEEAPAMIPTTEELLEYVLQQPVTPALPDATTTTSSSTTKSATPTTLRDIYHQIQHLQRNCVQKTHEKVYVAQQAFELIDAQVQRLDSDIHSMELLLQVDIQKSNQTLQRSVLNFTHTIHHPLLVLLPYSFFHFCTVHG